MFGEVRSYGSNEKGGDANPVLDEICVHADVGGDFSVPVASGLKLIKAVFQSVFVVRTEKWR